MNEMINKNEIKNSPEEEAAQARKNAEIREELRKKAEEEQKLLMQALETMKEGKGRLTLEKPILSGDKEVQEFVYDFTELTGMDYTEAMDSSPGNSQSLSGLSYRQALSLFAKAAAKQNDTLDMKDIISRIGITDAAEAVELASIFFAASIRAGRKRISKK